MQTDEKQISIVQFDSHWIVRVADSVTTQVFSCPSEKIALQFAAVFERASSMLEAA
jgi:hypothetical protein